MAKKNFLHITVFFVVTAGFLGALFIFQMFFANQNFTTKPLYGSIVPSQLTDEQVQTTVNSYVWQMVFFNKLPNANFYPALSLPALNVSSSYKSTVISNGDGFDFAPTVMKDGNGYKMWWCGMSPANASYIFGIYYATSNNSYQWSQRQLVLEPTYNSSDGILVCQPSVVKVNDIYYMYNLGMSLNITNTTVNASGSIFLATSTDGIEWNKYPSNDNPQPVISPPAGEFNFVNQPSVLYYNNKFYVYYTNSTSGNGTDTFLATSSDGIHFGIQNNVKPVFISPVGDDRDVKFLNPFQTFFMVYGSIDTNKIFWMNSSDGINWQTHDASRTIQTRKHCSFSPAFLSYPNGTIDSQTAVYFTAGDSLDNSSVEGCINPASWTIDVSLINVTQANIVQAFNATNFKCGSVSEGFSCKFNYINTLNESATVVFLFVDSNANVIADSIPVANRGISQTTAIIFCSQMNGTVKASWKAFRQSDLALTNPIAWSKSTERQSINC